MQCYAGSRGSETPRSLSLGGKSLAIEAVLERWSEAGLERSDALRRVFRVRLESGMTVRLEEDQRTGLWVLREDR